MIFKTFNTDIDKWTAKIGIFGKSFNELGNAVRDAFKTTIDNIDNFDEDISFWDALKNNLAPKNENGESWLKNSLGEIISKENIDSYIAELDLDSAKDKLSEIFDWETDIKNGDATWQDYFDTLQDGSEHYIPDLIKNTDDLSKLTGEDLVKANQAARNATISHNAALKQQTLGAKAGQVALRGLSIAGSMLASVLIMMAISKTIQYFSDLAHAAEEVKENAEDFSSSFKQMQESQKELQEFYDDLMNTEGLMQINTVAKELGIGEYTLFAYLRGKKVFFYDKDKVNVPYERFRKEGKFVVKETPCHDGNIRAVTYATKKGLEYIRKILRKDGYYNTEVTV